MADFSDALSGKLIDFIAQQHIFFVATAPKHGRINLSPKGMDTFRVISSTQVAYLDLTGSGNETAAHLLNDGRMTIMLCSFGKNPLILRLYGRGYSVQPHHEQWPILIERFTQQTGQRQIMVLDIDSVQTSCGYSIPYFEFNGERETLKNWAEKKANKGLTDYWRQRNLTSIDDLPTGLVLPEEN